MTLTAMPSLAVDRRVLGEIKVANGQEHHPLRLSDLGLAVRTDRQRVTAHVVYQQKQITLRNIVFSNCPFVVEMLSSTPQAYIDGVPVFDLTSALADYGVTLDAFVCVAEYATKLSSVVSSSQGPRKIPAVVSRDVAAEVADLLKDCNTVGLLKAGVFFDARELRHRALQRLQQDTTVSNVFNTWREIIRCKSPLHPDIIRAHNHCKNVTLFGIRQCPLQALIALPMDILSEVMTSRALCVRNKSERASLTASLCGLAESIGAPKRLQMLQRLLREGISPVCTNKCNPKTSPIERETSAAFCPLAVVQPTQTTAMFDPRARQVEVRHFSYLDRVFRMECDFSNSGDKCVRDSELSISLQLVRGAPALVHCEMHLFCGPRPVTRCYKSLVHTFSTGEIFTLPTGLAINPMASMVKIPLVVYIS